MENVTLSQIFNIGSWIVGFCGVIAYIFKPFKTFLNKIDGLERRQKEVDEQLEKRQEDDKMILKCLNAVLLHMESGNGTGELRKQKKELDDYLINR